MSPFDGEQDDAFPDDRILHRAMPAGAASGKKPKQPKPYVPIIDPTSLASNQIGRLIDLISEGEIEGFTHGDPMQDVYFDEVQASNYSGVKIHFRAGTPDQDPIPGFPSAELPQSVGIVVKYGQYAVREVLVQCDAVRVTLGTDSLHFYNKTNGDLRGWQLNYSIGIRPNGRNQGVVDWRVVSGIVGRTESRYTWEHTIDLREFGEDDFPMEVWVEKRGPNNSVGDEQYRDTLFWDAIFSVDWVNLNYKYCALVGTEVRADQFDHIPATAFDMLLQRVRVPDNYTPWSWDRATPAQYETNNQPWEGDWKWAWTDNPAWILYDLMTSKRFGTGEFVDDSMPNRWQLYQIARLCDEAVSDGRGGVEPRFACSLWLSTDEEAYKVFRDIASIFRGLIFWATGGIHFSADQKKTPLHLFTPANVVDGTFTYSGTARRARHTQCVVRYTNAANFFQPGIVFAEKREGVIRYGPNMLEMTAFGCTSKGQAQRACVYALISEWMQRETCSWATGDEGIPVFPGHLARCVDPDRGGKRWGGRLLDATVDSAQLDGPITLQPGLEYRVAFAMPDLEVTRTARNDATSIVLDEHPAVSDFATVELWADWNGGFGGGGFIAPFGDVNLVDMPNTVRCRVAGYDVATKTLRFEALPGDGNHDIAYRARYPLGLLTRTITTAPGEVSDIEFTPNLPTAPEVQSLWYVSEPNTQERVWQVLSTEERQEGIYAITGIEYREEKFDEIENDIVFTEPPPGLVPPDNTLQTNPPTALTFRPELFVSQYDSEVRLNIDWLPSTSRFVSGYRLRWKYENDNWVSVPTIVESNYQIPRAREGTYDVEVRAVSSVGGLSPPLRDLYELGATTIISNANITGFEIADGGNDNVFDTPDCPTRWRLNAPHMVGAEFEESNHGAGSAALFPYFRDYEVRIYDADRDGDGDDPIRVEHTSERSYIYTIAKNREDGALDTDGETRIPRRRFTIAVAVRDVFNRTSRFSRITVSNPPPPVPIIEEKDTGVGSVWLFWKMPPDLDAQRLLVWAHKDKGYLNDIAHLAKDTLVFRGAGNPATWNWEEGTTCYFRFAVADTFDELPETLNLSGEDSVTTGTVIIDPDALPDEWMSGTKIRKATIDRLRVMEGEIIRAHIQDAAIDRAKIQDGEITTAKIALAAIKAAQIDNGAITTAKIGTAQIKEAQIDELTVGTNKIKVGAVNDITPFSFPQNFEFSQTFVQVASAYTYLDKDYPLLISFAGSAGLVAINAGLEWQVTWNNGQILYGSQGGGFSGVQIYHRPGLGWSTYSLQVRATTSFGFVLSWSAFLQTVKR